MLKFSRTVHLHVALVMSMCCVERRLWNSGLRTVQNSTIWPSDIFIFNRQLAECPRIGADSKFQSASLIFDISTLKWEVQLHVRVEMFPLNLKLLWSFVLDMKATDSRICRDGQRHPLSSRTVWWSERRYSFLHILNATFGHVRNAVYSLSRARKLTYFLPSVSSVCHLSTC